MNEQWLCPNCGVVGLNTAGNCERCNCKVVVPIMPTGETAVNAKG